MEFNFVLLNLLRSSDIFCKYPSYSSVDKFNIKSLIDRGGIFPYEGFVLRRKYIASPQNPEFISNTIDNRFVYRNLFKDTSKTTIDDPIHTYYHCEINPLIVAYIYYLETVIGLKVFSNDEEVEYLNPMVCTYWN